MPTDSIVGLRDRALIGLMAYTFARIGAVVAMNVKDFFPPGHWVHGPPAREGRRRKQIPATACSRSNSPPTWPAAGLADQPDTPLFRTVKGKTRQLTENRIDQSAAWRMLQRGARLAGVDAKLCNHTWRASGITTFLENDGTRAIQPRPKSRNMLWAASVLLFIARKPRR